MSGTAGKQMGPNKGKLTTELVEQITLALKSGSTLEVAAEYVGVPRRTFFDWIARGRKPRCAPVYRELVEAVEAALANFEVHTLARIMKAGDENWQALAWMLERKFPDRYGKRTRVDSNVTVQAVPFADMSKLTVHQQKQLIDLLTLAQPNQEQLAEGQRPALELLPGTGET